MMEVGRDDRLFAFACHMMDSKVLPTEKTNAGYLVTAVRTTNQMPYHI